MLAATWAFVFPAATTSIWTETIRQMAQDGSGNVLFLDGSPEGMNKQMRDLMAMGQLNVAGPPPSS